MSGERAGARSELWGRAAEDQAGAWYAARGGDVLSRRARTEGGELDLVVAVGGAVVFVEVKARRTIAAALEAMTPRKQRRLAQAAECFIAEHGLTDRDMRFDVAAVDRSGRVEVVENALMAG